MVPAPPGWGSDKPLLGLGPKQVCGCVQPLRPPDAKSGLGAQGPDLHQLCAIWGWGGVLFEPQSLHRKVQQAARHCPPRVLSTGTVKV